MTEELLYKFENGKYWIGLEDWQILTIISLINKLDPYDDLQQLQGIFIQCKNAYKEQGFKGDKESFDKLLNITKANKESEAIENDS